MSTPMQRGVSRPSSGRYTTNQTSQDAGPTSRPDVSLGSVTDYMLASEEPARSPWHSPHATDYHAARIPPRTSSLYGGTTLRAMTPEQRLAYVAQRDAETAASRGASRHPVLPALAEEPPPTPTIPMQYRTSRLEPAPAASPSPQQMTEQDLPNSVTPYNSSEPEPEPDGPDASGLKPRRANSLPTVVIEAPMDSLPTPPATPEQAASPERPSSPEIAAPEEPALEQAVARSPRNSLARSSIAASVAEPLPPPIHMFPPRRRDSVRLRPDVEVEVRGSGAERVVTIRFMAASGATATR